MQIDTGSREHTDVLGHLAEVINSLISVGIQLVQSGIDLSKIGPLFLCIGQNGLNRIKLKFVLLETLTNAFGKTVCHLGAGSDSLSGEITHGNDSNRFEFTESRTNIIYFSHYRRSTKFRHGVADIVPERTYCHFELVQSPIGLFQTGGIGANLSDSGISLTCRSLNLNRHLIGSTRDIVERHIVGRCSDLLNASLSARSHLGKIICRLVCRLIDAFLHIRSGLGDIIELDFLSGSVELCKRLGITELECFLELLQSLLDTRYTLLQGRIVHGQLDNTFIDVSHCSPSSRLHQPIDRIFLQVLD